MSQTSYLYATIHYASLAGKLQPSWELTTAACSFLLPHSVSNIGRHVSLPSKHNLRFQQSLHGLDWQGHL